MSLREELIKSECVNKVEFFCEVKKKKIKENEAKREQGLPDSSKLLFGVKYTRWVWPLKNVDLSKWGRRTISFGPSLVLFFSLPFSFFVFVLFYFFVCLCFDPADSGFFAIRRLENSNPSDSWQLVAGHNLGEAADD
jgi:hypothetical protein